MEEMDWTVYWVQSIACFISASTAMFSGITGAVLMFPWFLMGFAVLGVPEITTQQATVSGLFLETAAFSIGNYHYNRRGLIDFVTVRKLGVAILPIAVLGAIVSHQASEVALRVAYSILLLASAWLLFKRSAGQSQEHDPCSRGEPRKLTDSEGNRYTFCAHGLRLQRAITGGGGFMTGLISTGVGEVTVPPLILRSHFPIPIAAATSIVLIAVANLSASASHFAQFMVDEGFWGVPGMAAVLSSDHTCRTASANAPRSDSAPVCSC